MSGVTVVVVPPFADAKTVLETFAAPVRATGLVSERSSVVVIAGWPFARPGAANLVHAWRWCDVGWRRCLRGRDGRRGSTDRPVPLDAGYAGPATIVGYTVVFMRNEATHAVAIFDTPRGARMVVRLGGRGVARADDA